MPNVLSATTVVLYALAAVMAVRSTGSSAASTTYRILAIIAVLAHGAVLATSVFDVTSFRLHLDLFKAASVTAWITVLCTFIVGLRTRINALVSLLFPLTALVVFVAGTRVSDPPGDAVPIGILFHIVLAFLAYALFVVACFQAIFFLVSERRLRRHHSVPATLPSLAELERTMFQLVTVAFSLLTTSLLIGATYVTDIGTQHLHHKITFAILAWCVFLVLLGGRFRAGWRGATAAKYVLGGMFLLALSYFGSKAVLELVLERV